MEKNIEYVKNKDGTRTDHWKQDKPHAPYLAMIAVGEFHEEIEEWNKIPLHYMVEKGFGEITQKKYLIIHLKCWIFFWQTQLSLSLGQIWSSCCGERFCIWRHGKYRCCSFWRFGAENGQEN
jgi:hypothetical protein